VAIRAAQVGLVGVVDAEQALQHAGALGQVGVGRERAAAARRLGRHGSA
jgi:hypothetical protein